MTTKTKAIEGPLSPPAKKAAASLPETTVIPSADTAVHVAAAAVPKQAEIKQGVIRAMKSAEQIAQFNQGNIEAMIKSSQIFATGLTDMTKVMAATAKINMEETMSMFKALTSVKSVKEAYDLQTSFAKSSMEKAMAESGKLTEHSLKLAEQTIAPLTARVNAAVETFTA